VPLMICGLGDVRRISKVDYLAFAWHGEFSQLRTAATALAAGGRCRWRGWQSHAGHFAPGHG
jgi:hypothetical protein